MLTGAGESERWQRYQSVRKFLVNQLGAWVEGWCRGEIDGGPVRGWCCYDHSFLKGKAAEEPALTADKILSGLKDWEAVLNRCEKLFDKLTVKEPIDLDIAVIELVNFAVGVTAASDAWYHFCHDVLSWYLESLGLSSKKAVKLSAKAIRGQFESWSGPSKKVVEQVAETFRESVWRALPGH